MLFKNKCATFFYAFPYLRTDMLHLTDIILFLVCAYDANLKQVTVVAVTTISLIINCEPLLLLVISHDAIFNYTRAHQTRAHQILAGYLHDMDGIPHVRIGELLHGFWSEQHISSWHSLMTAKDRRNGYNMILSTLLIGRPIWDVEKQTIGLAPPAVICFFLLVLTSMFLFLCFLYSLY
ncbi:hypothetical protein ACJX0J_040073, partial [Zea mays]